MCCMALTFATAMATTELTRNNHVVGTPWLPQNVDRKPVRMNWVVVTENGKPQLRIHWSVPAQDD